MSAVIGHKRKAIFIRGFYDAEQLIRIAKSEAAKTLQEAQVKCQKFVSPKSWGFMLKSWGWELNPHKKGDIAK